MNTQNSKRLFKAMILSILLTGAAFWGTPTAQASSTACIEALSRSQTSEFSDPKVLSQFLKEDSGLDVLQRFQWNEVFKESPAKVASYYTSNEGHRAINATIWLEDYLSPESKRVGKLIQFLAGGNHSFRTSYAGATLSQEDFNRFQPNETYQPGYFFSSSQKLQTAFNFLQTKNPLHAPQSHVKVLFTINGRSGREITNHSVFDQELEILYPPHTQFKVELVKKRTQGMSEFDFFAIHLREVSQDPPRLNRASLFIPERDFLRLQPKTSDETETIDSPLHPINLYSPESLAAFRKASEFVILAAKKKKDLSLNLLREIHRIALAGDAFPGYHRRRIRLDYLNGKISEDSAVAKMKNLSLERRPPSPTVLGAIRSLPVDNFVLTGLHLDPEGERFFTPQELFQLSVNPFFHIQEGSIHPLRKGSTQKMKAKVLFVPAEILETYTLATIEESKRALSEATNDYEYVMAVLTLQQRLMSLHPFHDGNGRAIKLLSDFLYLTRGLAPPLRPNELDYSLSVHQLYEQTVEEMKAFVDVTEKIERTPPLPAVTGKKGHRPLWQRWFGAKGA